MILRHSHAQLFLYGCMALAIFRFESANAHVHHVSLTEIRCVDRTMGCEAMLRYPIDEMERVLSAHSKTSVRIEEKDLFHKHLASYLARHFVVRDSHKKTASLKLLGFEKEGLDLWVFFEFSMAGQASIQLQNSLFFETSPNQVNTVNLYRNKLTKPVTFHFSHKQNTHTLEFIKRKRPAN